MTDDICYDPRQAQGYRGEDDMNKATHTPLPWKWRDDFKHIQGSPRDGETYGEAVTNHGGLARPKTTGMANAALIVEAVNNYESLRAQLASAKKALEECLGQMGWTNYTDAEMEVEAARGNGRAPIILRARTALKAIEGKP